MYVVGGRTCEDPHMTSGGRMLSDSPVFLVLLHHYEQLEMKRTVADRRKTVAGSKR
mgnify:FL=1